MPQAMIKRALYFSALNKLKAELSDLEVKEMLIVNNPVAVMGDGRNDHVEELKKILVQKCDLRGALEDVEKKVLEASKAIPSKVPSREGKADSQAT